MSTTYDIDSLKGGDVIVLPFRIPQAGRLPAIPRGTAVEVFDTYSRGGRTVLRVIAPYGVVRSVIPASFISYEMAA